MRCPGSTASTRKAAATQIGEVVKVHPDELQMLMCRVHTCLRSKSWDTRIAAGEAFEAIAGNVPQWNPPGKARQPSAAAAAAAAAAEVEAEADGGEDEMFRFETFNVLKVLAHAQPLLGSKGLEYELDAATMALDPKARLKKQRQMLKSQLAHGEDSDILEKGAPSGFEGFLDNDDVMASRTDKRKRDDVEDTPAAQIVPAIDFTGMSARERNQAKRLAKQNAMKKGREANMVAPSSSAAAAAAGGARATTVTEQTDPGKMVVETHLDADQLFATAEEWPVTFPLSPHPLRFCWLRRPQGVSAPHQCSLESVASFLCHFMLTCYIPLTRNHDAGLSKAGAKSSAMTCSPQSGNTGTDVTVSAVNEREGALMRGALPLPHL